MVWPPPSLSGLGTWIENFILRDGDLRVRDKIKAVCDKGKAVWERVQTFVRVFVSWPLGFSRTVSWWFLTALRVYISRPGHNLGRDAAKTTMTILFMLIFLFSLSFETGKCLQYEGSSLFLFLFSIFVNTRGSGTRNQVHIKWSFLMSLAAYDGGRWRLTPYLGLQPRRVGQTKHVSGSKPAEHGKGVA